MSGDVLPRALTRIREEMYPSTPLKAVLDDFLEQPATTLPFHTQAERVVSTDEFRGKDYQEYVRTAERRLKKLGRKTFALASEVNIRADEAGITLFFKAAESGARTLYEMTAALDEIEWEGTTMSGLYVRFARSALAKDVKRQNAAAKMLVSRLRHPSAEQQMRVADPRIVSRDILSYDE